MEDIGCVARGSHIGHEAPILGTRLPHWARASHIGHAAPILGTRLPYWARGSTPLDVRALDLAVVLKSPWRPSEGERGRGGRMRTVP